MEISFVWDEKKNKMNFLKHGILFEEAQVVWRDEHSQEFFDEFHSIKEERFIKLGMNLEIGILVVVFCERNDGNAIRIISARKAVHEEKMNYWKRGLV